MSCPREAAAMVRSHHECWDGSGRPDGLRAEAIPAGSRILAVADCLAVLPLLEALDALQRTNADRIEVRRERTDAFNRELRMALAGTVWHTGCTSWYVDEDGNDPNQWPWMWSTYRRRTQHLEPGAYDTGRPPSRT